LLVCSRAGLTPSIMAAIICKYPVFFSGMTMHYRALSSPGRMAASLNSWLNSNCCTPDSIAWFESQILWFLAMSNAVVKGFRLPVVYNNVIFYGWHFGATFQTLHFFQSPGFTLIIISALDAVQGISGCRFGTLSLSSRSRWISIHAVHFRVFHLHSGLFAGCCRRLSSKGSARCGFSGWPSSVKGLLSEVQRVRSTLWYDGDSSSSSSTMNDIMNESCCGKEWRGD
jgi:hypothetical protein